MVIAAVLCIFQGLAYAEVGSAYPVAGGEYSMVARVLGKALGIITFGLMSAMYIFVPTAASLAAGGILGVIWPWAGTHTHIVAVLVIVYAASVSFLKVKLGTWVAAFFVAVQIVALLVVTVLGLVHCAQPVRAPLLHPGPGRGRQHDHRRRWRPRCSASPSPSSSTRASAT